jgi:hypothetical protein
MQGAPIMGDGEKKILPREKLLGMQVVVSRNYFPLQQTYV